MLKGPGLRFLTGDNATRAASGEGQSVLELVVRKRATGGGT